MSYLIKPKCAALAGLRSLAPTTGLLLATLVGTACGQAVDTTTWGFSPGANVLAIARNGNTIYLGGNFNYIGPSTGGGVPVNARSAIPLTRYPRVVGRVYAVVADGGGGWYIGGRFSHVGGQPRVNLAHILADGSVSAWAPDPDQQVWAITLVGETLYVGGDFNFVGGEPRAHLAALSPSSSTPLPWTCDINSRVTALVASGPTLYVGGWFAYVAGQPWSYVAAVDLASGVPTPWQVNLDDQVKALALQDTTLYIGGYFSTANGEFHRCLVAVGTETGSVHAWDPGLERTPIWSIDFGPHVNALLIDGRSLFVAGSYSKLGGQTRRGIAQLDLAAGQATSWTVTATFPRSVGAEFWSLLRSGDTLFVAGEYDSLGGVPATNASALSVRTGERFDWDPRTNDYVFSLALQGGVLYVGGWFTSVGEWVERRCLAAIDANTGRVTDWDPRANSGVRSLLVHGGKVFVGGNFDVVGGQPRSYIAALDPATGLALPWNPGANSTVYSVVRMSDAVVACGLFSSIGGEPRRGLAAIDTSTGLATAWNPQAGGDVYSVAVSDSVVYVGGDFLTAGGQSRRSLAALDPVTGMATPWNPGTDGSIDAITLLDGTIYVGGWFHNVGGLPRDFLAAFDRSGTVTPWAPNAFGPEGSTRIHALAASDSTVFAGGYFSGVSGESREYFAAMDAKTAAVRHSYPTLDGQVLALAASDGSIYVGGGFGRVGSWPIICFAAIMPPQPPGSTVGRELSLAQCAPNPVLDQAVIRYSLPASHSVSLTVFDLQGRSVATVLSEVWQTAGPHQVSLSTAGWRPGCYLYRLEAGSLSAARKMVVIR
ncbi:MAG: T9SS type A sorting domain-containing protein [Candidatus Eisenbacteria bacterium]|nr:T9SS type A sorting domain-containing protein [Candidatus Eisenbacteria bacterium]